MAKETVLHNEPAFARPATDFSAGDLGLTKREYFAAAAMQGFCSSSPQSAMHGLPVYDADAIAKISVAFADALIDCLNENPKL